MPEVHVDIEVWCSCGEGLCNQSSAHLYKQGVVVDPCEKCLEEARKEGYDEGYSDGIASQPSEEE